MTEIKPKRRWFHYSLRTFLIVVTVCGVWLGLKFNAARQQQLAAAKVRELGGSAIYEHDDPNGGSFQSPRGPNWLTSTLGLGFFHDVVDVYAPRDASEEELAVFLKQLPAFPALRHLSLVNRHLSKNDLEALPSLTSLESINLAYDKRIGDAAMLTLQRFIHLKKLLLRGSLVTGQGLASLSNLKDLEELDLAETDITDADLEYLTSFPRLEEVNLCDNPITDKGLDTLSRLKNLKSVYAFRTQVTNDAARRLERIRPGLSIDIVP